MMIAHASLIQVWAYEYISIIRPVGLQRMRDGPKDMLLVCWIDPLGGYRPHQFMEVRRREIGGL